MPNFVWLSASDIDETLDHLPRFESQAVTFKIAALLAHIIGLP